ncbi:MAG: hypothetical protein HRT57_14590 [Crocinitomicaceae bacterium]|nr:hypothetical protein [Crocinitomicaceae bacterium]
MVIETILDWDNDENSSRTETAYEGKSSIFTRAYAPVGIRFQLFKHFNIGLETNIGIGIQSVVGGQTYLIPMNTSVQALVSWPL